jgi:hypothetical protein
MKDELEALNRSLLQRLAESRGDLLADTALLASLDNTKASATRTAAALASITQLQVRSVHHAAAWHPPHSCRCAPDRAEPAAEACAHAGHTVPSMHCLSFGCGRFWMPCRGPCVEMCRCVACQSRARKKVVCAACAQETLEQQRAAYAPVAAAAAALFFALGDLSALSHMYRHSRAAFLALFHRALAAAAPSVDVPLRLAAIRAVRPSPGRLPPALRPHAACMHAARAGVPQGGVCGGDALDV